MNMTTRKIFTSLLLLLVYTSATQAQSRFEEDFDDETKPWQEIALQLPAAPLEENLVPFYVSPTTSIKFAIDSKSVTTGSDDVVRYVLVAKSASGATNISYEGIRCQTTEVKLYAFGHKDGTWARSRRDKWEPIVEKTTNRQHAALAQDYLCKDKVISSRVSEMMDRMRSQRPFTHEHSN